MAEAQEQALGMFADAVLKLALHIQQQALDVEDLDQKVRLAGAVHRLGRGLRQTVALQAKLARDARAEAAKVQLDIEPPEEAAPLDPKTVAVQRRRDWLTRGVERCVWTEYDRRTMAGSSRLSPCWRISTNAWPISWPSPRPSFNSTPTSCSSRFQG